MALTDEQAAIVNYIKDSTKNETILINAVAGAGKTYLLTQIAERVPHKNGIYLAYNKSVATEAGMKFPRTIQCSTIHSLAYRAVVRQHGLRIGSFSPRDIKERMTLDQKMLIIETIREFCLSSYLSIEEFCKSLGCADSTLKYCKKYLNSMYQGDIECTHDFYLKLFHMCLSDGRVKPVPQDFLMIDEAGDINEVTLEIFKLMSARFKLAVGDNAQNIYGFNNTINAFDLLEDVASFNMTQSFRVSADVAERIEKFCRRHIREDFSFKGIEVDDPTIRSVAYIGRTNSGLIGTIIDLMNTTTSFTLVRRAADVFKLPLMLTFLKHEGTITDPAYRHIQDDVDSWYTDQQLRQEYKTVYNYLLELYDDDLPLASALRLILSRGKTTITNAYNYAKGQEGKSSSIYLATAHSVKGLEYDRVVILDDLNTAVQRVLVDPEADPYDYEQETNLYYVACSRAKKELRNAVLFGA